MLDAVDLILSRIESMARGAIAATPNLVMGLSVLFLFWLAGKAVRGGVRRVSRDAGQPEQVARVFGRLAAWVVNTLGFLLALSIVAPSIDTATLFSTLGIGGVAFGFAFKDILQNLLAGLLLLVTRPFRLGDQIVSGAHEGTIEDIELRATRMRTYDNRMVLIPNSELFTTRVIVNTANERRRVSVLATVPGDDPEETVRGRLLAALAGAPGVLESPSPSAVLRSAAPGEAQFEVRVWADPATQRSVADTGDMVIGLLRNGIVDCSAKWTA